MSTGHIHRGATTVLSAAMLVIGVALAVQSLGGHGGLISGRMLMGVLFIAAGTGRLYVEARRGRVRGAREGEAARDTPGERRARRRSER